MNLKELTTKWEEYTKWHHKTHNQPILKKIEECDELVDGIVNRVNEYNKNRRWWQLEREYPVFALMPVYDQMRILWEQVTEPTTEGFMNYLAEYES